MQSRHSLQAGAGAGGTPPRDPAATAGSKHHKEAVASGSPTDAPPEQPSWDTPGAAPLRGWQQQQRAESAAVLQLVLQPALLAVGQGQEQQQQQLVGAAAAMLGQMEKAVCEATIPDTPRPADP